MHRFLMLVLVMGGTLTPQSDLQADTPTGLFGTGSFRHGERISTIQYSPDGKHLVTASHDFTVSIWEVTTGKEVRRIAKKGITPQAVQFTPDGKHLLLNNDDSGLDVFDWPVTDAVKFVGTGTIEGLAVSADGKWWATVHENSSSETSVLIGPAHSRREILTISGGSAVAFADDSRFVLVGLQSGNLVIRHFGEQENRQTLLNESAGPITSVAISHDGKQCLVAHRKERNEGKVVLWDLVMGKTVQSWPITGTTGPVLFSPDDQSLFFADKELTQRDRKTFKIQQTYPIEPTAFTFSPDGKVLTAAGRDPIVRFWNLATHKEIPTSSGHSGIIQNIVVSPDGNRLISAGSDGLRLWDTSTLKELGHTPIQSGTQVQVGVQNRQLLWGQRKGIDVYSDFDFQKLPQPPAQFHLELAPDQDPLFATSTDGKQIAFVQDKDHLILADASTGKTITSIAVTAPVVGLAYAPNGRELAVSFRDGLCRAIRIPTDTKMETQPTEIRWGRRVQRLQRSTILYSPDGWLVATRSAGRVALLDALSGRQLSIFEHGFGEGDVSTLAFSKDGRFLAAGMMGPRGVIRIWDIHTAAEIKTIADQRGHVHALAFSPDRKTLFSAGSDMQIRAWDISNLTTKPLDLAARAVAWEKLENLEPREGYQAILALTTPGPKSLETIRNGIRNILEDQVRVQKWIRELDNDEFRIRANARRELEKLGYRAMLALKAPQTQKFSAEGERQIRLILEAFENQGLHIPENGLAGDALRLLRVVPILDHIGGAEAKSLLQEIAKNQYNPAFLPASQEAQRLLK